MFKLYRSILIRKAKNQKAMIILTMLGFAISLSLITVIQMISVGTSSYAKNNGQVLNHGDICIDFTFDKVNNLDSQQKARIQFLDYLQSLDNIDYTYEHVYENRGNLCYVNSDAYVSESPILRFIDMNKIYFFTSELKKKLSIEDAVLARNLTNRMPANIGDSIYISPGGNVFPLQLQISDIILDNEVYIQKAVENSYIFLDRSVMFQYLQITNESLEKSGYTKENYLFLLPTIFYVNGEEKMLSIIENEVKSICKSNSIGENFFKINKPQDARIQIKKIYNMMDSILSIFAIFSFLLSCCSIIYLVYMILFDNLSDINILKIYGLNDTKCILLIFAEVLLFLLPAIFIGIISGYFTMKLVVSGTSLYGIMKLGVSEIIISICNIIFIVLLSIAVITIPLVIFVNKLKITGILRKQYSSILLKKQTSIIAFLLLGWILFVFSFATEFKIAIILLTCIVITILLSFLCTFLIIKLIPSFPYYGILCLCIKFIKKHKVKIGMVTVPVALMIYSIFIVISCNYTLLDQAEQSILKSKGYNIQIMTTKNGNQLLESYLENTDISYFSKYDDRCTITEINNIPTQVETSLSFYAEIPELNIMQPLKEGAIVNINLANNAGIKVGDVLRLKTPYENIEISVSSIYKENIRSDFSIAIYSSEKKQGKNDLKNYYLITNTKEGQQLKEFVDTNDNMIIVSNSKMALGMISLFFNNKLLINLLTIYFIISSIIVVMYCIMIIYKERISEFCIYSVYGATEKDIRKIVFIECISMGIIACICGFLFAVGVTFLISKYSLPVDINLPLLILILISANIIMCLIAIISINTLKWKNTSVSDLLREQEV